MTHLQPIASRSRRSLRGRLSAGFTVIELLVVTALIVVISSVVLANNSKFGGVVQLENYAYDVALTIRQAQVYGIAVQRFGASNNFTSAYGMHFDMSNIHDYILFADVSGDGIYTSSPTNEMVDDDKILRGYYITSLCVTDSSPTPIKTCSPSTTAVDITFVRPEPDAYIRANGLSGTYRSADIVLASPKGETMTVSVYSNGQITVSRFTP
jgi:prepilin-type N-terminal cleavage/methylation domain-containing protein